MKLSQAVITLVDAFGSGPNIKLKKKIVTAITSVFNDREIPDATLKKVMVVGKKLAALGVK